MFSDQNGIKLEINNKNISGKLSNINKLHGVPLNESWVNEEILREIKKYFELNDNENNTL